MKRVKDTLVDVLQRNELALTLWAGMATFTAYFSMYMFRKPFTAAQFEGMILWGIDYKILLVIAQVAGYAISKFVGIKIISELKNNQRLKIFLSLILTSWLALILFAFASPSLGIICLFVNGLPLGLIWGIVFTYCEGRRITEILTVVLSINFVLSSGFAKTLGKTILQMGYSAEMMPMIAGAISLPLLVLSIWMLGKIPNPSQEEVTYKSRREPMTRIEKKNFLRTHWLPLLFFTLIYLALTIIRDMRDNFAAEIWDGLGYQDNAGIFSASEVPVALVLLVFIGLLYRVRDNKTALSMNIAFSALGCMILIATTWLFQQQYLSGLMWMICSGIGLFLPYILFNGIIFDRFIAAFQITANVGFIMYIADSTGYLGSVAILIFKNFGSNNLSWIDFYQIVCFTFGVPALLLSLLLFLALNRQGQLRNHWSAS